jgi:hypothetical protein
VESNGETVVHYPLWRQKTRDEDGQDGEHHRAPCVSSLAGSREDRGLVFFIERFQLMALMMALCCRSQAVPKGRGR